MDHLKLSNLLNDAFISDSIRLAAALATRETFPQIISEALNSYRFIDEFFEKCLIHDILGFENFETPESVFLVKMNRGKNFHLQYFEQAVALKFEHPPNVELRYNFESRLSELCFADSKKEIPILSKAILEFAALTKGAALWHSHILLCSELQQWHHKHFSSKNLDLTVDSISSNHFRICLSPTRIFELEMNSKTGLFVLTKYLAVLENTDAPTTVPSVEEYHVAKIFQTCP